MILDLSMDIRLAFAEIFGPDANMTNDSIIYGVFKGNKITGIGWTVNESNR